MNPNLVHSFYGRWITTPPSLVFPVVRCGLRDSPSLQYLENVFINIFSRVERNAGKKGGSRGMSSVVWLPCQRQGHVLTPANLI